MPGRDIAGTIARVVGFVGRTLVVAGLLLLYYTAYLLWGTNVYTRGEQAKLLEQVKENPAVAATEVQAGNIPPAKPATPPKPGDPLFEIVVPKIGLRTVVVQGVEREELKRGPGHFADSPFPGEDGNVAISGHRTTFGAPFFRLNELQPGDQISIESGPARYKYVVSEELVVTPDHVEVVESRGKNEITLTTCHPRFSASQRLIVHADYQGAEPIQRAAPLPAGAEPRAEGEELLRPARPPIPSDVGMLAAMSIAAALGAMALSKRLRILALWTALVLVAAGGLWVSVFPQVLRLMPANY